MHFLIRPFAAFGRRLRDIALFGRWGILPHYIFGIVIVLTLVFSTALPVRRMVEERRHEAAIRRQVAETRAGSAQLQADIDRLSDPTVVEEQARVRLGLVRAGETPLVVVDGPLPVPGSTSAPKKKAAAPPVPAPSPKPSPVPSPSVRSGH